uniref:DUF4412 domain-containing protein n=1 Tax=Desulfobacca acetoxidans TaxID=60893 RepID=A0A7V4G768_9BACT
MVKAWLKLMVMVPWVLVLGLALPLAAAEFTAQMVLKDRDQVVPGRLYVKDGKLRHEFLDESGHTITIVRKDKRLIWVLMPFDKTYQEIRLGLRLPGQFLEIPPEVRSRRKTGTETLEGYQTEKYECLVPGGEWGLTRHTYWVSDKLGMPLKLSMPDKQITVEYRNIKEGPVADRLFEVPPGYRRIPGPGDRGRP